MSGMTLGPQTGVRLLKDLPVDVRFQSMMYAYDFADGLMLEYKYRRRLFTDDTICAVMNRYIEQLRIVTQVQG
ncbi:MAG: hypothetical protein ACYCU0_06870 [Solirubrobacteraceae bacterium]